MKTLIGPRKTVKEKKTSRIHALKRTSPIKFQGRRGWSQIQTPTLDFGTRMIRNFTKLWLRRNYLHTISKCKFSSIAKSMTRTKSLTEMWFWRSWINLEALVLKISEINFWKIEATYQVGVTRYASTSPLIRLMRHWRATTTSLRDIAECKKQNTTATTKLKIPMMVLISRKP